MHSHTYRSRYAAQEARQNIYGDRAWYLVNGAGVWGLTAFERRDIAEAFLPYCRHIDGDGRETWQS